MLIRTNIYNRNYYPIKIYNLQENILDSNKKDISTDFYINGTSFDNHIGALIKPFQDSELISSISLKDATKDFSGNIYLDSTINTDSIDYGTFGILSGWDVNIKHHYVVVKVANSGLANNFITKEDMDLMTESSMIQLKFSMKDISDWDVILDNLERAGFKDYDIENVDFYGSGIYKTTVSKDASDKFKCVSPLKRSSVAISTETILEIIEARDGAKYKVYKEGKNVYFDMILPGTTLVSIFNTLNENLNDYIEGLSSENLDDSDDGIALPLFQLPLGISVILQMKTLSGSTPYKLNLKIVTPLTFLVPISQQQTEVLDEIDTIKPLTNFFISPFENDLNTLICTPSITRLLTNPNSVYGANISLVPFSFSQFSSINGTSKDLFYTLTNIRLKNVDDHVINDNINFISDTLPAKRIIPQENIMQSNNNFNIYIDTTNISDDYTNTLIIDYLYDGTSFTLETDVKIYPTLPQGEPSLQYINNSIFLENSFEQKLCSPSGQECYIYDKLNFSPLGDDILHIKLKNIGEADAIIDDIEFENAYIYSEELTVLENKTSKDIQNKIFIDNYIDEHQQNANATNSIYNANKLKQEEVVELIDKTSIKNYLSYKVTIKNPIYNAFNTGTFEAIFNINKFKPSKNYINGIPTIFKVTYHKKGSIEKHYIYLCNHINFNLTFIIGEMALMYDKSIEDIKYVRPGLNQTLFVNVYRKTKFNQMLDFCTDQISNGINIKQVEIINYDNIDNKVNSEDYNIDSHQFPLSVSTMNSYSFNGFSYDIIFNDEKLYKYKLRLYTTYKYIPYIDIPMSVVSTNVNVDEVVQFDKSDFYVRNNKYYLSLVKLQNKTRQITIKNDSPIDLDILEISTFVLKDKFNTSNLDINITNIIKLPFVLSNKNSLKLDLSFLGKDFGHYSSFIILKSTLGDVYLHIAAFINTKYKDVYVMMENVKGTNFVSALNGVDIDYIKLTNFGDDKSLLEINKLGYDQDEFLIANVNTLSPNTINYIENIFVPSSTGKKIGWLDFKIRDMLETYKLIDTDDQYVFKLQNSHILAEMVGISLTDHAMPHFSRSVVDFGFVSIDKKTSAVRVDTFTIKNYGLTPFVITKINKTDITSPFEIPLFDKQLPIKVDKEITLPIYINNKKFIDTKNIYMDVFKFEIQDLKSKRVFNYEIIVKVELTENNREYMSFNSEFIEFGYCEINNFKTDDISIKNFSTDKVMVTVDYEGDVELQTLENFSFNLWPNQQFQIPVYFYPHGIDNFTGKLKLNFNNGNYIKDIDLFGMGVDFKSPLITIENKMASYYKSLKDYLGNKKYL